MPFPLEAAADAADCIDAKAVSAKNTTNRKGGYPAWTDMAFEKISKTDLSE